MMLALLHIFFFIFYSYLFIISFYLLVAAIAGRFPSGGTRAITGPFKKIAVLITSFKEDEIILNTVKSALAHDYEPGSFRVFVAADQLKQETLQKLRQLDAEVHEVQFEIGSKARSLNHLLNSIDEQEYEIAMVLDGDNIMLPGCLKQVNAAFVHGLHAVQVHRIAKNLNNSVAILDAISEEINNHLFRKAQRNLNLSAATIGSGMAFRFIRLKAVYNKPGILDNPACDREVDFEMMRHGVTVEYLDKAYVLDEKVSSEKVMENQRRRWLESQIIHIRLFFNPKNHVANKNRDYWNKLFINLIPPRILFLFLIGLILLFALIGSLLNFNPSGIAHRSWVLVCLMYVLALMLSIPDRYFTMATLKAFLSLPSVIFTYLKAAFSLNPRRKEFVHTPKSFTEHRDLDNGQS